MRAALPHTEGIVDRDGVKLHYEIYGEGEQTIVFIPTWMFIHSRGYKAQVPYFSERFRCITWDPRGNGKSDRPTEPEQFGQDHYVKDTLAILEATNTDKAIFFGYSQSGPTCTILASYFPGRTLAVITVGTHCPLVPRHEHNSAERYNSEIQNPEGWEKYNRKYWLENFGDFADFFSEQLFVEPHSTKQIEDVRDWSRGTTGEILAASMAAPFGTDYVLDKNTYSRIACPMLAIHGTKDPIAPEAASRKIAELTGCELHVYPEAGHAPHARFPAHVNTLVRDFLARHLGTWHPDKSKAVEQAPGLSNTPKPKKILYLSSPIGLGHARRDLAIARELSKQKANLEIEWLAQDPVTRFLDANDEKLHPASKLMASESHHIEEESGEHDLNVFQAIRSMDEILIKNFMVFQEAVEQGNYDLVIADEAWDVDHYWHEHPELKKSQVAWLTDFVGWVPFRENGRQESFLTTDYNAEMIGHVEQNPMVRDRAIFVGNPPDIIPMSFGKDLPMMRDWVPQHYDFSGYVIGQHPSKFGSREELRERFGYGTDEKICIVTVGGSGVGGNLVSKLLAAYPIAKHKIPELRMIVVTGPRLKLDPEKIPAGIETRPFVPDLDRHLAACDLALVQGGLTTCMELAAAGTPFIYFPLKNHFEQNFHVAHRLERYNAGRKMIFDQVDPDQISDAIVEELNKKHEFKSVESDGAIRAASMLSELL